MTAHFLDIHAHLTDSRFQNDLAAVISRAEDAGVKAIVVNGLETLSNRETLAMAETFDIVKPSLGIYPVNAVSGQLPEDFPLQIPRMQVEEEIHFIQTQAEAGRLIAIGECGLDGHWLDESYDEKQEDVFIQLIKIAKDNRLPLIVHTRKKEKRCLEILAHYEAPAVNLHCFCGKAKLALEYAEKHGWTFSIPANVARHQGFQRLAQELPAEALLTETDAPYLSPVPKTRNEPVNVVRALETIASLRKWSIQDTKITLWNNYKRLINSELHG